MTVADGILTGGYGALTMGTGCHVFSRRRTIPAVWIAAMIVGANWLACLLMAFISTPWTIYALIDFGCCTIFLAVALKRRVWWALALGLLYATQIAIHSMFQNGPRLTPLRVWWYEAALNVLFLGQLAVLWAACRKNASASSQDGLS